MGSTQASCVRAVTAAAVAGLPGGTCFDMRVVVPDASGGADGAFTTQKVQ